MLVSLNTFLSFPPSSVRAGRRETLLVLVMLPVRIENTEIFQLTLLPAAQNVSLHGEEIP